MRIFLFGLLFLLGFSVRLKSQVVTVKLLNSETKEPVAYANAVTKQGKQGTASNIEGVLRFQKVSATDTLLVSYVGYRVKEVAIAQLPKVIFLEPKSYQLNAVTVMAEDIRLFQLVSQVRKKRKHAPKEAKTYFHLASYRSGKRVELLESYYNAKNRGYELDGMNYKIGRVGLDPKNQSYWVSSETSKAFLFHHTFQSDMYFPDAPLEKGLRSMRKDFRLSLMNRYEEEGHVMYHIGFEPRGTEGHRFSGAMWIDSTACKLIKVTYEKLKSSIHPFVALGKTDIQSVDIALNKTFAEVSGAQVPERIDFDYTVHFLNQANQKDSVQTQAALFFYDYNTLFHLPMFEFTSGLHEDYRMINATPYNEYYWGNHQEFRVWGDQKEQQEFLNAQKRTAVDSVFEYAKENKGFEAPYMFWASDKRVHYYYGRDKNTKMATSATSEVGKLEEDYAIGIKLYLDVNLIADSVHYCTAAIMDPYATFFNTESNTMTDVILNLCLDETEIHRQALLSEISTLHSYPEIALAYVNKSKQLHAYIKRRLFDVKLGVNRKALQAWNEDVYFQLGIDNINALCY